MKVPGQKHSAHVQCREGRLLRDYGRRPEHDGEIIEPLDLQLVTRSTPRKGRLTVASSHLPLK